MLELHAERPTELIPWLEELVTTIKYEEPGARLRVAAGVFKLYSLNYATRHRLRAEADLWKMLNADARPAQAPPAKVEGPKDQPAAGDWLDAKKPPPSLFPELVLPSLPKDAGGWHSLDIIRSWIRFAAACPRLSGNPGLTIEAGDGTLRRLLKARLYQGALELHRLRLAESSQPPRWENSARYDCTDDVLAVAVELFGRQPRELIPWFEELLIDAKEWERYLWLRMEAGAVSPSDARQATRHRLKVEAELWKVKNPK